MDTQQPKPAGLLDGGPAPKKLPDENWPAKIDEMQKKAEDWATLRQMMVNVNYYLGNQWIGWNRESKRVVELPREHGIERVTKNKIRPRVLTLLSKHTKNKIKYDVIPASKEQRDVDAAKAADKYLNYLWEELKMSKHTADIFLNTLVKGWCMGKVWFDATAGQDITPAEGDVGYQEGQGPVNMGEIRFRVCDAFTIFVDPSATCEEEIRWVIEKKALDVEVIEEEYGTAVSADANMDALMNSYDVSSADTALGFEQKKRNTMAFVYEMWHKPCKKYPDGLKVTVAGGKVLDINEQAGDLPYVLFGYQPIPNTTRYDALVKDMIPIQRAINVKRTMIATHAKRLGNALWMVPLGSGVDEDELTDETGGIVHYTPIGNMKPERAQAPDIPSFYDRDLQQDAIDMDDMSGAREVSQGRMPAGLDTLGGLEIMVEQENEKLTVASMNYENGMKQVMGLMLKLLKKHYTEERQARILGDDNEIELINFNGSELNGSEDVVIIQGSSLPEMKAAQQERIMLMWNSGAIVKRDGMPDHQTLLRLMGLGDSTDLFEQTHLDENRAKLDNKMFTDMAQNPQMLQAYSQNNQERQIAQMFNAGLDQAKAAGMPITPEMYKQPPPPIPQMPLVRDFQDHDVHLYYHNLFRKSSDYEELPPEVQQLVDAHVAEHEQMAAAPMQAQMAQQQQMQQQQADQQTQQQTQQNDQKAQQQAQQAQHQEAQKQADHSRSIEAKTLDHAFGMQKDAANNQAKASQTGQM